MHPADSCSCGFKEGNCRLWSGFPCNLRVGNPRKVSDSEKLQNRIFRHTSDIVRKHFFSRVELWSTTQVPEKYFSNFSPIFRTAEISLHRLFVMKVVGRRFPLVSIAMIPIFIDQLQGDPTRVPFKLRRDVVKCWTRKTSFLHGEEK